MFGPIGFLGFQVARLAFGRGEQTA
jgi:hypothetical protein